ncbi:MAG TPA: hypothetical protein PK014_04505 [Thermoanaerobaculia bacterium]|nr:hypothetical protein [Thermoanaerobaculia bacterium]HUM29318.1 hypothetical protein [Thermoanaerobaculia bacterium]HXK67724.1 hypothetical protein [Thermoanaerobaculia bacterium]
MAKRQKLEALLDRSVEAEPVPPPPEPAKQKRTAAARKPAAAKQSRRPQSKRKPAAVKKPIQKKAAVKKESEDILVTEHGPKIRKGKKYYRIEVTISARVSKDFARKLMDKGTNPSDLLEQVLRGMLRKVK